MATVFFSYSHKDEAMRDELETHLSVLKRQKVIDTWYDRRIDAGVKFGHAINTKLAESNIILLLLSPYFLASDYCYEKEMESAIKRHNEGKAKIIPIILEYCDWENTPLKEFLAIPKDGKPISEYPNLNKAFNEITQEIRKVAEKFNGLKIDCKSTGISSSSAPISIPTEENRRSSNLRIKKEFSDYDRDKFMSNAFEYMAKFFENSLKELTARNIEIKYDYKRIDSDSFIATLYSNGKEISSCKIRLNSKKDYLGGITYSHGGVYDNSINASLDVKDDGHILYLSSQYNCMGFDSESQKLSFQGASEYYWSQFIEPLQR